jgi:WD40 repeat protein
MLCGHYDTVNCVAVNSELDVVVTASKDKTCIVSSLSKARYARTIQHDGAVTLICLSTYGDLITYCPEGEILYLHTVNGRRLRKIYNAGKISVRSSRSRFQ